MSREEFIDFHRLMIEASKDNFRCFFNENKVPDEILEVIKASPNYNQNLGTEKDPRYPSYEEFLEQIDGGKREEILKKLNQMKKLSDEICEALNW